MRLLSLDISTKTGYSVFDDSKLVSFGNIFTEVKDFNVNKNPNLSPLYPLNILNASEDMGEKIFQLWLDYRPDVVVIENSVKGRNRHTQRLLEWIHKAVWDRFTKVSVKPVYMDPSEWRKVLEMRLTKEDKENNKLVSKGKKRGRITKKHLSVRLINQTLGLKLKLKDNDVADSLNLALAYLTKYKNE